MLFEQELTQLLLSQNNLIFIQAQEETRLEYSLHNVTTKLFQEHLYSWNFIDGYINHPEIKTLAARNPLEALEVIESIDRNNIKVFFLKDFSDFLSDIIIIRKIKNIYPLLLTSKLYIIISSLTLKIPNALQGYFTIIDFPLPNKKEIYTELQRLEKILKFDVINIENFALAYQGFSIDQIRKSIMNLISSEILAKDMISWILKEKKYLIEQTNILDFYPSTYNLEDIGGIKNLKKWLQKRSYAFSEIAQNYGIPVPKGILLVGIQGTGKSLSAKAISLEWNLPLLKLDIGKIFAGIVGESENRMRQMIKLAEQMAPCILWIDEIDKIFTKHNINNDSGTTNRVMNGIIVWLSEKNTSVFIVATANSISNLPPEILRRGRFDEIFFLDLPNFEERLHIFQIHLKKLRPLTWNQYNIYYLSKISYQFSGAEIEQAIIDAMYNAFNEFREFNTLDIVYAIKETVPLAFLDTKSINQIQELAYAGKVRFA